MKGPHPAKASAARRSCLKGAALGAGLVFSAAALSLAIRSADAGWVSWCALLPVFAAIRGLAPLPALACGGLWGASFFLCCAIAPVAPFVPTTGALALLLTIPAAYTALGAFLTRRIGFNPVLLAVGWVLVELSLQPLGLRHGLLAGAQHNAPPVVDWISRALGFAFVAFLAAGCNALLLVLVSKASRVIRGERPRVVIAVESRRFAELSALPIARLSLVQTYPRAPPRPAQRATLCLSC